VSLQALQLQGNDPRSVQISSSAAPILQQEVLAKPTADVDAVSGATFTRASGAPPAGAPQLGTAVTGSTLRKLTAVATARYPGTVERAVKLSDGSYVVHVVQSDGSGDVHVRVSRAFAVTGVDQGPPGGGAPATGTAPGGATAPSGSTSA
jgi:hypothetical protein